MAVGSGERLYRGPKACIEAQNLPSVKGSGALSAVWGGAPSEIEFGTF